jgi:hypothetical protein
MRKIRVLKTPPGIAEKYIRDQWMNIEIPLATDEEIKEDPPSDTSIKTQNAGGYLVLKKKAIEALRESGKNEAASFWESLPIGRYLRFGKEYCEII